MAREEGSVSRGFGMALGCMLAVVFVVIAMPIGCMTCAAATTVPIERPEPVENGAATTAEATTPETHCGWSGAEVNPVPPDWEAWACRDFFEVSDWDGCLPRAAYTSTPGMGCPGSQRCCAP